ncbi:ABC transporter ATP-binding protein/permease [Candidatus Woesearchaeota archaeon]|nr:ABC transporter ATP-binding protein/permease [Candidatus Woesearchaeota archaeon]MCF7901382.1 ABC transporter ATP-binding protein/permease [Candidatus Woesearchaeota archaeon]MCF8013147.1 ABC transporter ATP-binding protein/permease [Candidatus Woesearchaeota archaeon]
MKNKKKINGKKKVQKPIDFKYNFGMYWTLIKKYKWMAFGLLLMILFFQSSYSAQSFIFKILTDESGRFIAKEIVSNEFVKILTMLALAFAALKVMQTAFRWIWMNTINIFETKVMFDIKKMMFNHVIHLDHEFHTNNKTGSLISRLIRGGNAVERLTDVIVFNFVPLLFQTVVVAGTIMFFDLQSALVVLITILAFIGYSFVVNKKQQPANMAANDAEDSEKAVVSDFLTNIESIKYFGKEDKIKSRYFKYGDETRKKILAHWNYFRWLSAGHTLILGLGAFFLIYFPVQKMLAGTLTIGTLVFIYASFETMIGHLFGFDHGLRGFYRSMADFESLFKYYKAQKTIVDEPDARVLNVKKGTINFNNVWFKYKNRYVLKDFNLEIPANKKIALVGPSGSGKSTLVKLLYRLYDVDKGSIVVDGYDIKKVKQESLRSELSIVPQEAVLFDETILNNVGFSNGKANKKEIMKAMKFAQLDQVVAGFPKKELTIVGERGVKLSGGEKQRVSIARAILADKKILVMDEATSALDSETEHEIQQDLENLMKGRTSIVIAHRLSTIMKADVIVVLDKGRVVQQGTHNELIQQDGLYKKLWNLQKGGYIK